jgi:ketosteroid isomerase-like protein
MERLVRPLMCVTLLLGFLCAPASIASGRDDLSAPIRQFIDAFNTGNAQAEFALYATGSITIVDEFAPHIWTGPDAAHQWADAYDKHAQATGVTDGKVTYGRPTRTEVDGNVAYVILPTVYLYNEHGKPLREEGQVTAVLNHEAGGWKIRSWTWSGVKPHPAK